MLLETLRQPTLTVVNVGLPGFGANVAAAGGKCLAVQWQPPAQGDREAGWALARLLAHPVVDQANAVATARLLEAQPVLVDIATARERLPGMAADPKRRLIVHAGPPIAWDAMCGPMRGAVLGAVVLEGWADSVVAAERLVTAGGVDLEPCHHHAAVGPMAGVISPSMPVFVVENAAATSGSLAAGPPRGRRAPGPTKWPLQGRGGSERSARGGSERSERGGATPGHVAFSNFNEGLGKVLRFGANGPEVIERLHLMARVVAPALRAALVCGGPIELKPLMAQALTMGDEVHNRNAAATSLFFKRIVPALLEAQVDSADASAALRFIAGNDHFFLNLSMAACKLMCDAASGVPGSSLVTAMARNGVNFGIRLAGTGDAWFEAPANPVDGLYFPGYSIADAAADLGDSAITETAGVGGFAMAAAPAIVKFVGGTPADALAASRRMRAITLGANPSFTLPALDFAPAACGIDARKVLDNAIAPIINSGIAHREAGVGQIGAGVTTAPIACFAAAVKALAAQVLGEMT